MAPIRLGVIGLSATGGWAATDLIPPIFDPLLANKYTLTALCASSEQSAKAAVEKYSPLAGRTIKGYYGKQGYKEIANDPEVDVVVVSVKIPEHYEALMPAVEVGKKIFVEWAPGKNMVETLQLAETARAKGVKSMVAAQGVYTIYARKVKEIIDSGKIGRVLSTSLSGAGQYFGKFTIPSYAYTFDIESGLTILTVPIGHFLAVLKYVLGTFTEVSALGTIRIPTAHIIDMSTGQPLPNTDPVTNKTAHDQIVMNGILKGRVPEHDGIVANIHYQGGISVAEPFRWVIYGEEGTIEIKSTQGAPGDFIATHEKDVYLNGKKVELEETEMDKKLGPTGKAWLELTKGEEEGIYETLDSAADIYRVVDAALISIREGRKIIL